MMARRLSLSASELPDGLRSLRTAIEAAVPHGRTASGGRGDRGAWGDIPNHVGELWSTLKPDFDAIVERHPKIRKSNNVKHLGTLGTGNHFIELCLDQDDRVWVMLHSGSRGVGNRIGTYFIALARKEMERWHIRLPDKDLAYLPEGSKYFGSYMMAVSWAQRFARTNREVMMAAVLKALGETGELPPFEADLEAVNCHHNYVAREAALRRGRLRDPQGRGPSRRGRAGHHPRQHGDPLLHRPAARATRTASTAARTARAARCPVPQPASASPSRTTPRPPRGVECRKDTGVIDETPAAYKDIEAVMAAQADLVDVVHTLRQVVCVKG